jgi:prepilin-type N-terminal cleavage/methylation domain-containing protein
MSNNKYRAITVIEMLVAISIIAILASFIYINLENYQPTIDLNGASRQLITDLRYAQELAVAQQVKHGIQFFVNEKKYQLIKYGESETIIKEVRLPDTVSFHLVEGLSLNRVRFNSYGAVEESGKVVLINDNSLQKTIYIRPSGFVESE